MTKIAVVAVLIFCFLVQDSLNAAVSPIPMPMDTSIRILIVKDDRLSGADVDAAINHLEQTWDNTTISGSPSISIDVLPIEIPVGSAIFSGTDEEQVAKVRTLVEVGGGASLREIVAADVVVALSSNIPNSCGAAPQRNWVSGFFGPLFTDFDPDENGLDLREANRDYVAVAQISGDVRCTTDLAAHEFGHLLGGGHFERPLGISLGLLSDSSAHRIGPFFGKYVISGMGNGPSSFDCPNPLPIQCLHANKYSDSVWGATDRRNANALATTAQSVANYRGGTGSPGPTAACSDGADNDGDSLVDSSDPDCTGPEDDDETGPPPNPGGTGCNPVAFVPTNVRASLTARCDATLVYSIYRLEWDHACPATAYLVEANQGMGTFVAGTVFGAMSTPIFVDGSPAAITVRACEGLSCSGASSPPVFIFDQC